MGKWYFRTLKRYFDIIGAVFLIIIFTPLFLYIGFKLKKDGCPILYRHERIGQRGESFKCLKFRTMVMNAEDILSSILASNSTAYEEWHTTFKLKNDPRITKMGGFLRQTSLDELPQLFNVLRGEMSLVGPRPIVKEELRYYSNYRDYYLMSKPGITGLWQVSGRSSVDYDNRVSLDVWYVRNWSMWADIVILFKTIGVVLRREGAY